MWKERNLRVPSCLSLDLALLLSSTGEILVIFCSRDSLWLSEPQRHRGSTGRTAQTTAGLVQPLLAQTAFISCPLMASNLQVGEGTTEVNHCPSPVQKAELQSCTQEIPHGSGSLSLATVKAEHKAVCSTSPWTVLPLKALTREGKKIFPDSSSRFVPCFQTSGGSTAGWSAHQSTASQLPHSPCCSCNSFAEIILHLQRYEKRKDWYSLTLLEPKILYRFSIQVFKARI